MSKKIPKKVKMKEKTKEEKYFNQINIFKGRNSEDFRFTYHFFNRWNERVLGPKFEEKDELELYIKENYSAKKIKHLSGDYYLMDDLVITCSIDEDDNSIVFITIYGDKKDNPILYNILISEGVMAFKKARKKYGKMNIVKY